MSKDIDLRKSTKKKIYTKARGKRWTIRRVQDIQEAALKHDVHCRLNGKEELAGLVDINTKQGFVMDDHELERTTFHEWLHIHFPEWHENRVRSVENKLWPELFRRGLRFWPKGS